MGDLVIYEYDLGFWKVLFRGGLQVGRCTIYESVKIFKTYNMHDIPADALQIKYIIQWLI